jgi:hypothetical protein
MDGGFQVRFRVLRAASFSPNLAERPALDH